MHRSGRHDPGHHLDGKPAGFHRRVLFLELAGALGINIEYG